MQLPDWPRAWGVPTVRGQLRARPEHFRVDELLELEFTGNGEFDWVLVEKTGLTTPQLADILKQYSGARDVSYSGLKDKHAVTRQWFSLHMLGAPSADWANFTHPNCSVLVSERHQRKLRSGTHRGNAFELVLGGVELDAIADRVLSIKDGGFPNYFGEQRFGVQGDNVEQARRWFAGGRKPSRLKKGIYLSAVRSFLFNEVLAERVNQSVWNRALDGDLFCVGDGNSLFRGDGDPDLQVRLEQGAIHPSGPLPGRASKLQVELAARALEERVLLPYQDLLDGLDRMGVNAARRALRVIPQGLSAMKHDAGVCLKFNLPRGCFATALVRELIDYSEVKN